MGCNIRSFPLFMGSEMAGTCPWIDMMTRCAVQYAKQAI